MINLENIIYNAIKMFKLERGGGKEWTGART